MSFLTPLSALVAAAVTVPLLLLLYFLKLRRRYVRIGSTLLWRSAHEDVEVNAPFQRLRFSILLLLQMLVLAALLLAMGRPVTDGEVEASGKLILLIDRSASMNAADAGDDGQTRLEAAKAQAIAMVERLRHGGEVNQVMVIAFGRTAQVVSGFEHDRRAIVRAIESIVPTDETADLNAALQLAGGFAGHREDAGQEEAKVVLFSDGGVLPPDDTMGYRLRSGEFSYVQVGPGDGDEVNNVGIAAFSARRDYEDPARVLVFARLINTGGSPVSTLLTLRVDDDPVDMRMVSVAAASEGEPGELSVTFSTQLVDGGVLSLEHHHGDVLGSDDKAYLVVPPPFEPRIALVHGSGGPDPFTYDLLRNMDVGELRVMTEEEFEGLDEGELDTGELFDMVVFDGVSAARLPGIATLTIDGVPRGVGVIEARGEGGRRILSWDRQHPIMRHVGLDSLLYAGFGGYELPPTGTALATGPEGPVIALLRVRGASHVLVGFDLNRSNWPLHVSIVIFMQNVLDHITLGGAASGAGLVYRPGQPITVRAEATASRLEIDGPVQASVDVQGGGERTLPTLRQAGVYRVAGAAAPMQQVAVSVLSDVESDIRPRGELRVNAEVASGDDGSGAVPRELWPWLVAIALVLLMLEWVVYLRKVRV